jgi:two-component system sensor histidine kinase UhpB
VQKIHVWSDEFYRIYGFNKGEVQPSIKLFMSFMHPDDADFARNKIEEAFHSFSDSTFNFRFIRKDGIIRHGCIEWRFEFDKSGAPLRFFGILQDITISKEAEEELRRSIELFQYATQASLDVIWELNFETKQYLVHKGKEKLFGINSLIDWELGLDGKYIVEEDKEIVRQSFLEAGMDTARTLWVLEYRVWSEDNSILYIINHATFIRDKKGKAVRVIGAITDITERKRLTLELLEQQRKEQLKIIATALEAQEKERNAIGIELHDNVNQILVATKLFLSMVNDDPVRTQTIISSCIENLQNAIEENRKIAHVLVAPDFEETILAGQLSILTDNMLKITGIDTHVYSTHLREELLNDEQKLVAYRIAQEQCTNIVKYAKARTVNISLSTAAGLFTMIISDDGVGMEPGKKTKGIGLRNMRGRLSIFNGTANINTAPGKGFTLEIIIPLKK